MLLYLFLMPHLPAYRGKRLRGIVQYEDGTQIRLAPELAQGDFADHVRYFVRLLESNVEPERVPSTFECRFCAIGRADCPDRIEVGDDAAEVARLDLF